LFGLILFFLLLLVHIFFLSPVSLKLMAKRVRTRVSETNKIQVEPGLRRDLNGAHVEGVIREMGQNFLNFVSDNSGWIFFHLFQLFDKF